jgi:hypothetical protein
MSRSNSSTKRRRAPEITIATGATTILLHSLAGWNWWAALGISFAVAFAAGFLGTAARDLFGREVPLQLADEVFAYQMDGWRVARIHTIVCDRKYPHVHLVRRADGEKRILSVKSAVAA